jgi:zinc/manganese transport system substrate-binding protein
MRFLSPFLLFLVIAAIGIAGEPTPHIPVVVTANTILDDLVRQIGGAQVSTRCLVAPGADPHTFEPRPSDVKQLVAADVLVVNGLGLEPAIMKLAENCGFRGVIVVASAGIAPRCGGCNHEPLATPSSSSAPEPPTAQSKIGNPKSEIPSPTPHSAIPIPQSPDPHAWQAPSNVAVYVANIRDALTRAHPAEAAGYQARASAYLTELTELDRWVREQIATIPPARRRLVTSHDTLGYFADVYGFQTVPVGGLSTSAEPNARDVAAIIDLIRREQVPAVFFELTSNPKLIRQIGTDAGVRLAEPLFTDSLGAPGCTTYLEAMRTNVSRIVAALR